MTDTIAPVECPACRGRKGGMGFVMRRGGCGGPEWIPCLTCGGAGTVTPERAGLIARGHAIWQRRNALDLSLRDAAKQLGVNAADMSAIERGAAPATQVERAERAFGVERAHG